MIGARGAVVLACAIACMAGWVRSARADVERFAVIIGHNTGAADEQRLRFAEEDAARVGELLAEVGGVPDENQVVLRGKSADQVRRALIATNERIRVGQRAGRQAMLFVYYSGHGDADALHLGDSRLELRELEALVRGSAAEIRVLAIDACRSGSVTRVKGGHAAPPIVLRGDDELTGEGVIILTASTAGEDAQESDDLRGSFFTHYLLSALRGAADDDGDQLVTIGEAFGYTRDQTILASSRTLAGVQHPTFHYDLRGRADIVLVDLGSDKSRGTLTVPTDASWLVVREGDTIVGEIGADSPRRTLSLRPGRYRVRGRSRDALLEGSAIVVRGQETVIAADTLTRTTYARLVRKGRGEILPSVTGVFAGPAIQSAIIESASPCIGGAGGVTLVRSDVTLSPRASACVGEFANETLTARTTALSLDLRVAKAWDVHRLTLDVGVTLGGELLRETFTTRGVAPSKTSGALHLDAGVGAILPVTARYFLTTEVAAQTHFFTIEDQSGARDLTARFAVRGILAVGGWL